MDRLDRLLLKVKPKPTLIEKLKKDNPYLGKTLDELMDYMNPNSSGGLRVPVKGTLEMDKFNYALIEAYCNDGK